MKALQLGLVGAISGALVAAVMDLIPLGDTPGIVLFGQCLSLGGGPGGCTGAPGELFLYPGLIFGLAFSILLLWRGRLRIAGAVAFAVAAVLANAVAVLIWPVVFTWTGWLFEGIDAVPLFAISGAIAGGVGGGVLGFCARTLLGHSGRWRGIAAGGILGLLLPLLPMFHGGEFAFYILWQAGYAAALLTLPEVVNKPER